jgi:hypothetical protein
MGHPKKTDLSITAEGATRSLGGRNGSEGPDLDGNVYMVVVVAAAAAVVMAAAVVVAVVTNCISVHQYEYFFWMTVDLTCCI